VTGTAFGNGMSLAVTFDARGRESLRKYGTSGDPNIYRMSTDYDRQDNVKQEKVQYRDFGEKTRNCNYDGLSRLTFQQDVGDPNVFWTLDKVGNWKQAVNYPDPNYGTVNRTANADNEYKTVTGDPNVAHDARGNLTHQRDWQYTYDWANRLIKVEQYSGGQWATRSTSSYDAFNRRVMHETGVGYYQGPFVYDGPRVIYAYDEDEPLIVIYGKGGQAVAQQFSADMEYFVHDRLGSVVGMVGESGSVLAMYRYSAYGKLAAVNLNTGEDDGDSMGEPWRYIGYTGQMRDHESGLWYYRNRHMDPLAGRFLQRDPAGWVDGMNMYAYVRNNPLRYTDPYGLTARSAVNYAWNAASNLLSGFHPVLPQPVVSGTWGGTSLDWQTPVSLTWPGRSVSMIQNSFRAQAGKMPLVSQRGNSVAIRALRIDRIRWLLSPVKVIFITRSG